MKVFLSWSGELSHRTALVFREWLPSVIQSIVPYVSSEDIDKGARWSTDIAKELEESTFGILCVTKENVHAPWLTFEAGALSKTMTKSAVCPFLFDIKRSEVNGPILQFQSTIFEREDVKKLVYALNQACGEDMLSDERLEKAFQVWYSTLEAQLNNLLQNKPHGPAVALEEVEDSTSKILEEILDLSRNNQKLLRNPEGEFLKEIESLKALSERLAKRLDADLEYRRPRRERKLLHPMLVEELMHISPMSERNLAGFQIVLSLFKGDYPWLYDVGLDVVRIVRGRAKAEEKREAVAEFLRLVEFTFEHPLMREIFTADKEISMAGRELPRTLHRYLERYL
jgi:hypothetical protein